MLFLRRVGALSDSAFNPPVLLFSPNRDGTVRRVELATVQEGFRALHHGLEGFCLDRPEWHRAFDSLSRAMLDPDPERIEAAREALDLLATLSRIEVLNQLKKRAGREAARHSVH
jgi:hypothetical protein